MRGCPRLVKYLRTPKVLWYQTDVTIVLRIMLVDVKDYFLLVDLDHFQFSTTIDDRKYYLCLYFFGAVVPGKCMHSNKGREIRVTIPKAHRWISWPRLCLTATKNPQIIIDPDAVDREEFETRKPIERINMDVRKLQDHMIYVEPSSNEDESDDEMMNALFDLI